MISILIPTMNRSDYLIRALQYYASVNFTGWILIGDSSEPAHIEKIQQTVQSLQDRLQIIYEYCPKSEYKSNAPVLQRLIDLAPTPYVVYAGDDDFVIPRTLERCANFLAEHPDHSAVSGVSIAIQLRTDTAHDQIISAGYVGRHQVLSEKATDRWIGYTRQAISTQYYLHRTETWRQMYRYVKEVPLRYLGEEFLPCSISMLSGKVTTIDGLGCVFQQQKAKTFGWYTHSMYGLMTHPDWSCSANRLRQIIIDEIVQQDHLSAKEAQAIFDKEFWRHLNHMLQWHYMLHHDEPLNFYDRLKRNQRLLSAYLFLQRLRHTKEHKWISLDKLLDKTDSLHEDFMPVYQAITRS